MYKISNGAVWPVYERHFSKTEDVSDETSEIRISTAQ
jgi:hypothetical protein